MRTLYRQSGLTMSYGRPRLFSIQSLQLHNKKTSTAQHRPAAAAAAKHIQLLPGRPTGFSEELKQHQFGLSCSQAPWQRSVNLVQKRAQVDQPQIKFGQQSTHTHTHTQPESTHARRRINDGAQNDGKKLAVALAREGKIVKKINFVQWPTYVLYLPRSS